VGAAVGSELLASRARARGGVGSRGRNGVRRSLCRCTLWGKRRGTEGEDAPGARRPSNGRAAERTRWGTLCAGAGIWANSTHGGADSGRESRPAARSGILACRAAAGGLAASSEGAENEAGDGSLVMNALAFARAMWFFLVTFSLSLPLFVSMLVMSPIVFLVDRDRRAAQHFVNNLWAIVSTSLCYRTRVEGWENVPGKTEAAVFVANHQSNLDIYSLFHLRRPFKFISKVSVFFVPIVGWSMFLTGHVMLKRTDRKSQIAMLNRCRSLLRAGVPILIFPEGTRSTARDLAEFKQGAFKLACEEGVPIVPISLDGTGKIMATGREYLMHAGSVTVKVHPPIATKKGSTDPKEVSELARKAIASGLTDYRSL